MDPTKPWPYNPSPRPTPVGPPLDPAPFPSPYGPLQPLPVPTDPWPPTFRPIWFE
jgi:hypothetical protein